MLNQLELAIESANKATEVDPKDGYPYFLRGSLYLDNVCPLTRYWNHINHL